MARWLRPWRRWRLCSSRAASFQSRWLPKRGPAIAGALLAPLLAGAALWGLAVLSTPERERERDATRRPITVPPGFRAEVYADKSLVAPADGALDNPTVMTFGDGVLFIGDIDGNIWIGRDARRRQSHRLAQKVC